MFHVKHSRHNRNLSARRRERKRSSPCRPKAALRLYLGGGASGVAIFLLPEKHPRSHRACGSIRRRRLGKRSAVTERLQPGWRGFSSLCFFEMCSLNPERLQADGVSAGAPAREDSMGESARSLRRLLRKPCSDKGDKPDGLPPLEKRARAAHCCCCAREGRKRP